MGCIYSSFNPDLLICPPTLIMPFPSINGSREHNALALLKLLSFCFSLPSSSLKCFAWTYLIMLSLASCSNSTSINAVDSMLLVSIAFFCLIFCNKDIHCNSWFYLGITLTYFCWNLIWPLIFRLTEEIWPFEPSLWFTWFDTIKTSWAVICWLYADGT